MASTNVNINGAAYQRLKNLKRPGDSFSDVLLRELPEPCGTAGALLDYFDIHPVPKANPKLRRTLLKGRGRRSPRV